MKIVIIGASGTVGRAVTKELSRHHEVIRRVAHRVMNALTSPRRRAFRRCSKKLGRSMRLSPQAVAFTLARWQP